MKHFPEPELEQTQSQNESLLLPYYIFFLSPHSCFSWSMSVLPSLLSFPHLPPPPPASFTPFSREEYGCSLNENIFVVVVGPLSSNPTGVMELWTRGCWKRLRQQKAPIGPRSLAAWQRSQHAGHYGLTWDQIKANLLGVCVQQYHINLSLPWFLFF